MLAALGGSSLNLKKAQSQISPQVKGLSKQVTVPPSKETKDAKPPDGGVKVLYGTFKHLLIRKSGPGFRLDRIDKNPDLKIRKQFKENVTIEIKKEVLIAVDRRQRDQKAKE